MSHYPTRTFANLYQCRYPIIIIFFAYSYFITRSEPQIVNFLPTDDFNGNDDSSFLSHSSDIEKLNDDNNYLSLDCQIFELSNIIDTEPEVSLTFFTSIERFSPELKKLLFPCLRQL